MNGFNAEFKQATAWPSRTFLKASASTASSWFRSGGKLVRSAGQYAILRAKEGNYAGQLPSSEIRLIHVNPRHDRPG